jgi:hypothetical protein
MEEQSGIEWMAYIDGIPVAYHQTDMEGDVDPVAIEGSVADQSYIQWPDGTGVSLQLHHPADWDVRNGAGNAHDFYLAMLRLVQAAALDADTDKLWDYADDLHPKTFRPILPQEESEQE